MKPPEKEFDDVVRGARHCISGAHCTGSPGIRSCPYFDRFYKRCVGDWRKDLLQWALVLKEEHDRSRGL